MKTFLFDIDGTLLRSGGAGLHAMQIAMSDLFRIGTLAKVEVRGRTDRAIVQDLFAAHHIEDSVANWRDFQRAYHETVDCCPGFRRHWPNSHSSQTWRWDC
jgi:phosphoglycolate phosphatase